MSRETSGRPSDGFSLHRLLKSARFFKREDHDISAELRALECQILEGLSDGSGEFSGPIPETLLSELGAEIFDTLLSNYLKWYRSTVIAASQSCERGSLSFAAYAQMERPYRLGLGVSYEMENLASENVEPRAWLPRIVPVAGSVRVVVDASMAVRAVVAAMNIEKTVSRMLADPAEIVRKTLMCRLDAAYGYRRPIGSVGLSIADGTVNVTISNSMPG
jgi:hypothetical protein